MIRIGKKQVTAYINGNQILVPMCKASAKFGELPEVVIPGEDTPVTPDTPTEETYTVSGTWYFNEDIDLAAPYQSVNFTSNNTLYDGISGESQSLYYYKNGVNDVEVNWRDTWENQAYRTIAFDGTQTVSKEFYEWLVANAVRQTISFTIENAHDYDTTTYYADVGMTWAEWCDSEYNTRGGYIFNNTVMVWCYPTTEEYNSGLKDVVPTDVISNGGAYVATTDGPCVT